MRMHPVTTAEHLAVDAGGTSTRAVLVDSAGRCRGAGRASGGNPTSVGPAAAIDAVASAIGQALEGSQADPAAVEVVLIAHAGGHDEFQPGVERRLAALGVTAPVVRAGDLLALFASGTHEVEGAALIAGTGAIGGAIRRGRLDRVVDGTGWLLGDAGSGFWTGHRIARAVTDDLDGGPATLLTPALLRSLGLAEDRSRVDGRPAVLQRLVRALYLLPPVQLSRWAPLAFELEGEDEVARGIVRDGVEALAALLRRVRRAQSEGPLVFGGSVLIEGVLPLADDLLQPLVDAAGGAVPIPVADGLVGAAVLALRETGTDVDEALFRTLQAEIRAARAV